MIDIIFSFDTEDYVHANGADGILNCAEILRKAGIRGCFNIVARLGEALVEWGRTDILDALAHHEIDLHSRAHSFHPTINEYTDVADYGAALAEFLRQETQARDTVSRIFRRSEFAAACPPGNSVSYVAHYGYAEMGIPLYAGDLLIDPVRGRPIVSCNITCLDYHCCLDRFLLVSGRADIDAYIEETAEKKVMQVLYHHPQKALLSQFWDELNFNGRNTPRDEWKFSTPRDPALTEKFYDNLAYLVQKLKSDPRFRITTYGELARRICGRPRVLRPEDIPGLRSQLQQYFFPVTMPDSYCIADVLLACRDFLQGKPSHVCGSVHGFLETPRAIDAALTLTADDVRASADQIVEGFLPVSLNVGGREIGPADWLRAAMDVLCGAETVVLRPAPWQIDMDQFPIIRDQNMKGTWIHTDAFEDRYLSHRFRLQSWTYRLPPDSPRRIFDEPARQPASAED